MLHQEPTTNLEFVCRVQDIFKLHLTSPELRLKVIKNSGLDSLRKPPAPIYPRFPEDKENVSMVECEQKREFVNFVTSQRNDAFLQKEQTQK